MGRAVGSLVQKSKTALQDTRTTGHRLLSVYRTEPKAKAVYVSPLLGEAGADTGKPDSRKQSE